MTETEQILDQVANLLDGGLGSGGSRAWGGSHWFKFSNPGISEKVWTPAVAVRITAFYFVNMNNQCVIGRLSLPQQTLQNMSNGSELPNGVVMFENDGSLANALFVGPINFVVRPQNPFGEKVHIMTNSVGNGSVTVYYDLAPEHDGVGNVI